MAGDKKTHPLDSLMDNNSFLLLEALVPFVNTSMKKTLIIYIKCRELTYMLDKLNDTLYLNKCGFNYKPTSTEDMFSKMCDYLPDDIGKSIQSMRQMMNMMQTMEAMNSTSDDSSRDNDLYNSILNILDSNSEEI